MIKQVIVMRTDLGMRKGKMIAQGAHASMMFLSHALDYDVLAHAHGGGGQYVYNPTPEQKEWFEDKFTKICVRVDSEEQLLEIHQKALDAGLTSHLVTDAGLTEFGGVPTNTCIAIGPHEEEKINPITGELKLL